MQGESQAALAAEDFSDVFKPDRDSGADTAAPETQGQPRDDHGRFASKQVEAQQEAAPQSQPEQEAEDKRHHVPLKELLAERDRFKSERKLREEAERRALEHEARLRGYEEALNRQPSPQQQRPAPQVPDPYTQPEEFARYQASQMHLQFRDQIANMSEYNARRAHGDAIVNEAQQWAIKSGVNQRYFLEAADPYGQLITDYKRVKAVSEIGTDPEKYKETLRKQIRDEVMAELKAGGNKPAPKFPNSLADATQAGVQGAMLSPEAIAAEIFDHNRNRRAM